jgi:cysteine desulfurase
VATEHPAVLDPCRALATEGFAVTELPVEPDGLLSIERLRDSLTERTIVVSVMMANNEIGVIQPIRELAAVCRERGIWFHSDAAQAVGKLPVDLARLPIDLLSISGHKMYGPKGIGVLFVRQSRPRVKLEPLFHGGGHERGLRSGTLAVPLIVGLAEAIDLCLQEREGEAKRLLELRTRLWTALSSQLDGMHCNGHMDARLPGNLNVSFEGIDGDRLLLAMPDLAVSTGSACSSASPSPSHVLEALGVPHALARASIRFGLGRGTTPEQIDTAAARLVEVVRSQRSAT